ncbi:MAG: hypothetical protein ACK456_09820 [Pseudanabaenaceae cyanobacterium]
MASWYDIPIWHLDGVVGILSSGVRICASAISLDSTYHHSPFLLCTTVLLLALVHLGRLHPTI